MDNRSSKPTKREFNFQNFIFLGKITKNTKKNCLFGFPQQLQPLNQLDICYRRSYNLYLGLLIGNRCSKASKHKFAFRNFCKMTAKQLSLSSFSLSPKFTLRLNEGLPIFKFEGFFDVSYDWMSCWCNFWSFNSNTDRRVPRQNQTGAQTTSTRCATHITCSKKRNGYANMQCTGTRYRRDWQAKLIVPCRHTCCSTSFADNRTIFRWLMKSSSSKQNENVSVLHNKHKKS